MNKVSMITERKIDGFDASGNRAEWELNALKKNGFVDIELTDRNKWYYGLSKRELAAMSKSPLREKIVNLIGETEAAKTIEIWKKMIGVWKIHLYDSSTEGLSLTSNRCLMVTLY